MPLASHVPHPIEVAAQRRVAILPVSRHLLGELLRLPSDVEISAVHFDPERDELLLRLEGPSMPIVPPPDQCLTRVRATYHRRPAKEGESITELLSLGE